ncbi:MAG: polyphenol oxidase family protein [Gaiellaceae bacterium]
MADLDLIRWDAPGPYEVAFSTRRGGASVGSYASLNLGLKTDDEPEHVIENRRRLCAGIGAELGWISMTRQRHSAVVHRARRGNLPAGDGVWTGSPGEAVLQLTADCVPIAIARMDGERPAVVVLHAGWRGLLAGIVAAGVDALGPGPLAAAVGPSIGPCCYEVGPEVAEPFGPDVMRGRNLDLWAASERALRAAGVERIERIDLCTACNPDLFFSHRRDRGVTGRQGVIARVAA